jgi:hypothetical protein
MALPPFSVTYDYRCPFARNAHEHLVKGLKAGAEWQVTFAPFSLGQAHVEEGGIPVWEDPKEIPNLLAIETSLVVRDTFPERFLDVHLALFSLRHDAGGDLRDPDTIGKVLEDQEVDAARVRKEVENGWPRALFRSTHESLVANHQVFGVPTFIHEKGDGVFVRLMTRPGDDTELARRTIEHVVSLAVEHPELNEFKHTTVPR